MESSTVAVETQTVLTETSTALVTPIAIGTNIFASAATADIPTPTPADDLDSLPEVVAEEEVSNTVEAKIVGSKTRIEVSTEWVSSKLSITAFKKGVKKKYIYRFSTDGNGNYTFKSNVNLKGFTLILFKGSQELDRDWL
jgi:hypothetical protein